MKTLLLALLSLTLCLGCKTAAPADRAARVAVVAELATFTGATVYLKKHPESVPIFIDVLRGLDAVSSTNGMDVVTLQQVLSRLPVKELKGDNGALIVGAAVTLYEAELKRLTPIDQNSYAATVAVAVRSGLRRALASVASKPQQ